MQPIAAYLAFIFTLLAFALAIIVIATMSMAICVAASYVCSKWKVAWKEHSIFAHR